MTMSNEVGTHVGYCVYLKKPHYIFRQELKKTGVSQKEMQREDVLYQEGEYEQRIKEKDEVADYFKDYKATISKEQHEIVDKYWGTSSVKSPEELRSLFT